MSTPNLDHPTLAFIKERFSTLKLLATEFRGQTTLLVPRESLHEVLRFLRCDPKCDYDLLSCIHGVDYLRYPASDGQPKGRFGVLYNLVSTGHDRRLFIKVLLSPSLDTSGIEPDPALHLDSVCDIWPGAEWLEREVFDMFGIRFDNHPDLRRILLWESFPAHPLRKDYPLRGRGEREEYEKTERTSA